LGGLQLLLVFWLDGVTAGMAFVSMAAIAIEWLCHGIEFFKPLRVWLC